MEFAAAKFRRTRKLSRSKMVLAGTGYLKHKSHARGVSPPAKDGRRVAEIFAGAARRSRMMAHEILTGEIP